MNIFLTGKTGFVGSVLTERLDYRIEVRPNDSGGVSDFGVGLKPNPRKIRLIVTVCE